MPVSGPSQRIPSTTQDQTTKPPRNVSRYAGREVLAEIEWWRIMAGQLPSSVDASQGDMDADSQQVHVVESLGESSNSVCRFDESDEGFEDGGLGDWGDLFGMDEDVAASSSFASTSTTLVDDAFDDSTDVSSIFSSPTCSSLCTSFSCMSMDDSFVTADEPPAQLDDASDASKSLNDKSFESFHIDDESLLFTDAPPLSLDLASSTFGAASAPLSSAPLSPLSPEGAYPREADPLLLLDPASSCIPISRCALIADGSCPVVSDSASDSLDGDDDWLSAPPLMSSFSSPSPSPPPPSISPLSLTKPRRPSTAPASRSSSVPSVRGNMPRSSSFGGFASPPMWAAEDVSLPSITTRRVSRRRL